MCSKTSVTTMHSFHLLVNGSNMGVGGVERERSLIAFRNSSFKITTTTTEEQWERQNGGPICAWKATFMFQFFASQNCTIEALVRVYAGGWGRGRLFFYFLLIKYEETIWFCAPLLLYLLCNSFF